MGEARAAAVVGLAVVEMVVAVMGEGERGYQ